MNAKTLTANKPALNNNGKSFWDSLTAVAAPIAKLTSNQAQQDPKVAMRTRFEKSVKQQVALIRSAADKSRWFKKLPDGSYELTIRNGNTAMALNGNCFFQAKDAAAAVLFYEAVVAGTKAGELDDALNTSMRKPRDKKAAATPAPAPSADKK